MNGDDLISLAGNLAVNSRFGTNEARFRSAASRSYYGAFHLAAEFFRGCGMKLPRNHTGHEVLYRCLLGSGVEEAMEVARRLGELRTDRSAADYDLENHRFQDQFVAEDCVKKAHSIRTLLEKCREPSQLLAIEQGLAKLRPS